MKDIKDYLHLYIGYEVQFIQSGSEIKKPEYGILIEMPLTGSEWGIINSEFLPEHKVKCFAFVHDIKPILRPLSSITDVEKHNCYSFYTVNPDTYKAGAERTMYLLSKHFDLFGLIEAGLAIDATTLKQSA